MKNKFLVGTLTFFIAIFTSILFLNISNSSSKTNNYFERKFSNLEILKFDKEFEKLDKNSTNELFYTNNSIVEGKFKDVRGSKKIFNLFFSDCSFTNKKNRNILLPVDSNILLIDNKSVIYICKSKLYKLNLETNVTNETKIKNVDISFVVSIDESSNKFLFFGEMFENNMYKTGFFVLNVSNNSIIESKVLHANKKSYSPEFIVMNSGFFQKLGDSSIAFTCDKNSQIFLFNENGVFVKMFNTKDNTPMPKVIKKSDSYFYSHAGLNFSNSGLFVNKDNLFVFSMASKYSDKIIIDQYSKSTLRYIQSYKLDYKSNNSSKIDNVFIDKNKIILKFKFNYASFTFSRYI